MLCGKNIICNSNLATYEHELLQHPSGYKKFTQTTLNFFWRYVLQMGLNVEGAHCMVSIFFLEHI
jgi:hypothetical protein